MTIVSVISLWPPFGGEQSPVIGPYDVAAMECYVSGAEIEGTYIAGALSHDSYVAGLIAGEVDN